MRPKIGDRKRRWKQSHYTEAILFVAFGSIFLILVPNIVGILVAIVLFSLASLSILDGGRGWKIRYDIPPWGKRAVARGDKVAIAAAEETLRMANSPDRQRYAFEKIKGK